MAPSRPRVRPPTRSRLGLWLLAAVVPLSALPLILRQLPSGLKWRRAAPEPIDAAYGYSVGAACHEFPARPPESRPAGCAAELLAAERTARAHRLTASIVLIAHNEAGCALRRTLLSLAERSPSEIVKEIIVLDDSSSPPAEQAVAAAGGLASAAVRWVRTERRVGVARARSVAADAAIGAALVFLDAHCSVQEGWLPPLLAHLGESPRAVALPVIEAIDPHTWAYRPGPSPEHPPRGVIADWNLTFGWTPLTAAEREARVGRPTSPLASPAMAGGIFGMRRNWFYESGGYDQGLEVWGGENIEMSLRVWTCGGSLATLPCSRVGHVFRRSQPFTFPNRSAALTVHANARRVAAVWMDNAAILLEVPQGAPLPPAGGAVAREIAAVRSDPSLAERHALRRRLRCRSFRWYLEAVYPDHPPLPPGLELEYADDDEGAATSSRRGWRGEDGRDDEEEEGFDDAEPEGFDRAEFAAEQQRRLSM